jgi:hypothetical protein
VVRYGILRSRDAVRGLVGTRLHCLFLLPLRLGFILRRGPDVFSESAISVFVEDDALAFKETLLKIQAASIRPSNSRLSS